MRKTGIILALALLCANTAFSETTTAAFLKLGSSARASGMGHAYSSVTGDINAIAYNPGGINWIKGREFSFSQARLADGMNYSFAGYGMALKKGVLGVSVNHLSNSAIEGRSADRRPTSGFSASDTAANLSYGMSVSGRLGFGLNIKYIKSEIADVGAVGFAFDLGGVYRAGIEGLNLGLSMQNIGSGMKFLDKSEPLPLTLRAGAGYSVFGNAVVSVEADRFVKEKKTVVGVGVEYGMFSGFSVRGGYLRGFSLDSLGKDGGFSGGVGLKARRFNLEYAVVPFGNLGDSQRLSLGMKF